MKDNIKAIKLVNDELECVIIKKEDGKTILTIIENYCHSITKNNECEYIQ